MFVDLEYGQECLLKETNELARVVSIDYATGLVNIVIHSKVKANSLFPSFKYESRFLTVASNKLVPGYSFWRDSKYKGPEFRDGKFAMRKDGRIFPIVKNPEKNCPTMIVSIDGIEETVDCSLFLAKTFNTMEQAQNYWG